MSEAKPYYDPEAARQVEQILGDPKNLERLAYLGKVLSDESRLRIISTLITSPSDVSDLARQIQLSQSATSHHLWWLRQSDMVTVERAGQRRIYSIDPTIAQAFVELVHAVTTPPESE